MRKFLLFIVFVLILAVAVGAVFSFLGIGEREENVVRARPTGSPAESFEVTPFPSVEPGGSLPPSDDLYRKPAENYFFKFPVFNYHHIRPMPNVASSTITDRAFTVSPEGLETHLKYFKDNGYQVVLLEDLVDYFDTGKPLPPKAVALTFDDGWEEHYKNAFPILKKYGVKATFFVPTGWVGKSWILTWKEMREMSQAGMVFGSHSISHPDLDKLSDEELKKEVEDSKKSLEDNLGVKVDYLSYPAGMYNDKVIEAVKAAGYKAAVGVYKVIEQAPKYIWSIRRFHADDWLESITEKLVGY